MGHRLIWERDGRDWPNREASRFATAAGLHWHVQCWGNGPALVLVHGTGASTHSWRALGPLLAQNFSVVAPDLPGHGFTDPAPSQEMTLPRMAAALHDLLSVMNIEPALTVGHSAGAAILARMSLDHLIAPKGLISLNGAFLPFHGLAGQIFSPLAKALVLNPFVPRLFAWGASGGAAVERLIRDTGSTLDAEGLELYARLLRSPGHVAAALGMMANWQLEPLERDLPHLQVPLMLIVGAADRAISPDDAFRIRDLVPNARIERLRGVGHLAHEERPEAVAAIITDFARALGVLT